MRSIYLIVIFNLLVAYLIGCKPNSLRSVELKQRGGAGKICTDQDPDCEKNPYIKAAYTGSEDATRAEKLAKPFNIVVDGLEELSGSPLINTTDFEVVANREDKSIIVYEQTDYSKGSKKIERSYIAARFFNGTKWEDSVRIDSIDGIAINPKVAIASDSRALAVWVLEDKSSFKFTYTVYTSLFMPGKGWAKPEMLGAEAGKRVDIAYDSKSQSFWVLWEKESSEGGKKGFGIHGRQYSLSYGWKDEVIIAPFKSDNLFSPNVHFNDDGAGVVAWKKVGTSLVDSETKFSMWVSRFVDGAWSKPMWLSHTESDSNVLQHDYDLHKNFSNIAIDIDLGGNALISWTVQRAPKVENQLLLTEIWVNLLTADGKLMVPKKLSTDNSSSAFSHIKFNDEGEAMVTWKEERERGAHKIMTSYYSPNVRGVLFLEPVPVTTYPGASWNPTLETTKSGEFILAYVHSAGKFYAMHLAIFKSDKKEWGESIQIGRDIWQKDAALPRMTKSDKRYMLFWRQKVSHGDSFDEATNTLQSVNFNIY